MNPLEFLRLILPPRGWYVGFATKTDQRPLQYSFKTLEGLLAWLTRLDNGGYTTYYACAAFREFQVWDEKQRKFVRRTHENFLAAADLWADVDTRESHAKAKYVDQEEAARAILAFCQHVGLPPPLWVSSGGGVHVHWPLAEELELAEWEIYARGFRAAADDFGLAIDARKTLDGSAVLRVPGSHNYKFDPPRVVQAGEAVPRYPLAQFARLKELGLVQPAQSKRPTRPDANTDSPLAKAIQGIIYDDPSDPQRTARGCAQLGAFVADPGKFDDNFHYGVAGLCKISCDGGDAIYLSWLDPEYRDAGQTKLDNWHSDAPATCEYFKGCSPRPELCQTCPHKGKITTPCELGRWAESKIERLAASRGIPIQVASAPAEEGDLNGFPTLEPPFNLSDRKIVWEWEDPKTKEPRENIVSAYPIYLHGIYNAEGDDPRSPKRVSYCFRNKVKDEPWANIVLPAGEYKSTRGIQLLHDGGAWITDSEKFRYYIEGQFIKIRDRKRGMRYEQCGFKNDNRDFLCGDSLFKLGGGIEQAIVSEEIMQRVRLGLGMHPSADVRAFLKTVSKLFVPEHHCAHFNIAMSGGSIFHPWLTTTAGGLILINWTPGSARGKSMMLWAAGALWAWARKALSINAHDTQASMGLLMACLGNIPVLFDEINLLATDHQYGVQRLIEFIGKVAQGTDKNRANPAGKGLSSQLGNFGQPIIASSNEDLQDKIALSRHNVDANEAITKRLQILDGASPIEFDPSLGDELEGQLWLNGGAVMHAFLTRLSNEDFHKYARERLQKNYDAMWKSHNLHADHRIRIRDYACGKTWAELALEHGLWTVPSKQHIDDTFGWAIEQIKIRNLASGRTDPKDTALQVLNDYLTKNIKNTLYLMDAYRRHMHQIPIGNRVPLELLVRWERNTGSIYTPYRAFKTFVVERGHAWRDICDTLLKMRIIRDERRKMTLGAGTDYTSAQVDCIEFDGNHPSLQPLLEIE